MTSLCCKVLEALCGYTLATAESCTGGGIGAAITAVPGSSAVFKGGIIAYCDRVKSEILGVDPTVLQQYGAVSAPVAKEMANRAREVFTSDVAVSVTGLAGPGSDGSGEPIGTVYIGYSTKDNTCVRRFCFLGDRNSIRDQAEHEALKMILELFHSKDINC